MKYDVKYPNADAKFNRGDIATALKTGKCCKCGCETKFIELDTMRYVCSEECNSKILRY